MIKQLRGLVAIAIVAAFSALAFSPGAVLAVEKAYAPVVLYITLESHPQVAPQSAPQLVAKGKKSKAPKHEAMFDSAVAKIDGYMNWRMRDTTRSV